ncbi:unnamed protein product, partial [Pylaiella littoralis]
RFLGGRLPFRRLFFFCPYLFVRSVSFMFWSGALIACRRRDFCPVSWIRRRAILVACSCVHCAAAHFKRLAVRAVRSRPKVLLVTLLLLIMYEVRVISFSHCKQQRFYPDSVCCHPIF